MHPPTMARLRVANPNFFSPELGDFGLFKEHKIEEDEEGYVLMLHTKNNTMPVYRIGPDHSLSYLRSGW